MLPVSRRQFLRSTTAGLLSAAAALRPHALFAQPLGIPLGLQLYSVRELLPNDFDGTLKKIAALGYQEVEAAGFFHHTAADVKKSMQSAGLRCVSGHYPYAQLAPQLDEIIAFHRELGAHFIICASPGHKSPAPAPTPGQPAPPLTLNDWRWNAEEFNRIGKIVKAAGLQFGYHNHTTEFARIGDTVPYDELLRLTDPSLVTFEMDTGWVLVGGGNPISYLGRFANRISMIHLKDFKPLSPSAAPGARPEAAELGRGTFDLRAVLRAARSAHIQHCFVEQEGYDMPVFDSLKVDADFVRSLQL